MSEDYLLERSDGLAMRKSQAYAEDKLRILEAYIHMFIVSMRNKQWKAINYIDLQAGPGKNNFPDGKILLGSPLLALTANKPFDNYWFVELGTEEFAALNERVSSSNRKNSVHLLKGDCNSLVDDVIKHIQLIDSQAVGKWSNSLNLAFLDPEGLELQWSTVEKLGKVAKMDLIINFSTSGIIRNAQQLIEKNQTDILDEFFGSKDWIHIYQNAAQKDSTEVRRALIDFYKNQLEKLGYQNEEIIPEQVFKNTKNRQIYTLIFASKHPLGEKFWKEALERAKQPRLF